jgi:hypothetical protein
MFKTKLIVLASFALLTSILLVTPNLHSQLPSKIKTDDDLVRDRMISISRQLGVSCNACHNTSNYTSNEKLQFKVAKEHIRITQLLIDSGFDGQNQHPQADCYMCHRGQLKPKYKEPFDPMIMQKAKSKDTGSDKSSE